MLNECTARAISEDIRNKIKKNIYKYGYSIPSERNLASEYGVNRSIIRTAIDLLIEEKLVKRVHGKGTYIIKTNIDDSAVHFEGMSELLKKSGFEPSNKVLKAQIRKARYKFSKIFDVSEDTDIFHISRLRLGNDIPISIENTYIRYECIKNIEDIDFQIYSLYDILLINNIHIHNIRHIFSTTRVHTTFAKLLKLEENSPVFSIHLTSTTQRKEVAEYTEVLVAPNFGKYYTDGYVKDGIFRINSQLV